MICGLFIALTMLFVEPLGTEPILFRRCGRGFHRFLYQVRHE
jgi:hypothetical protein